MTLFGRFEDMVSSVLAPPVPEAADGPLKCADFFSGIGGFHLAARNLGLDVVFACDIDDEARRAYRHNFGLEPIGDIIPLRVEDVPDHDLLLAGFPCQPFSIIGRRQGFEDPRGSLFFELLRVIRAKRPQGVVLENVKQLATAQSGKVLIHILDDLKQLGYAVDWKVLNALDFGLPQKRERTIIVASQYQFQAFPWPTEAIPMRPLETVLEARPGAKYDASPAIREKRRRAHSATTSPAIWHENKGGQVSSHPWSCALRAGASYNYLLVDGKRRLTPREMLRLQGFPDSWEIVCNVSQTRKQAGNAVPVPMVQAAIKGMVKIIERAKTTGDNPRRLGPYPLGQIPDDILLKVGRQIVHRLAIGFGDIIGDDFATIFANAVGGEHRLSPLGVADVEWNGCAWSIKTVKVSRPFKAKRVRLISGRNSPDYSLGISDPHVNAAATGRAVLSIWNARVNEAMGDHQDLRIAVMVRNVAAREFVLFEDEARRFVPRDYTWRFNKRNNLEGWDKAIGEHRFTWQPHGSQFTILRQIPESARRFSIGPNVALVDPDAILAHVRYRDDWIQIHG